MTTLLRGGTVLTEKVGLLPGDLLIENGVIKAIGQHLPEADEIIDVSGMTVVPGLVDTHNHGAFGTEFASADEEFDKGTEYLAENGTTTVVPTIRCLPQERLLQAIGNIKKEMVRKPSGAKLAGINMEGPFLSPKRIGSMRPENLSSPGKESLATYLNACEGQLKTITIAPELPGVLEMIEDILFAGANPSIGHTDASYAQALVAVDLGANQVTHLFNAMRPFQHREPGVVGEALLDERLTCELICDYVHNAPASVDLAIRNKGYERIIMVSDTGVMSGLGDGEYIIENHKRIVKGNLCQTTEGVIAGSVCPLFYGVRNLLKHGHPIAEVFRMASLNPAKSIGLDHKIGSIAVGKDADLLLLNASYELQGVFVNGKRF